MCRGSLRPSHDGWLWNICGDEIHELTDPIMILWRLFPPIGRNRGDRHEHDGDGFHRFGPHSTVTLESLRSVPVELLSDLLGEQGSARSFVNQSVFLGAIRDSQASRIPYVAIGAIFS